MNKYQLKTKAVCENCLCADECDDCEYGVDATYHDCEELSLTLTYGELQDIPESELDPIMVETLRILRVAEQVGEGMLDIGAYVLCIEDAKVGMINAAEFSEDGCFRVLDLAEIPAAFVGNSAPRNLRVFVQDESITRSINDFELDCRFGLSMPIETESDYLKNVGFSKRWEIWETEEVADNLVEESMRLNKVHRYCQIELAELNQLLSEILFNPAETILN